MAPAFTKRVYFLAFLSFHYQGRIEFFAGSIYADLILNSLRTKVFNVSGQRNYFGNRLNGKQRIDIALGKYLAVGGNYHNGKLLGRNFGQLRNIIGIFTFLQPFVFIVGFRNGGVYAAFSTVVVAPSLVLVFFFWACASRLKPEMKRKNAAKTSGQEIWVDRFFHGFLFKG